MDKDKNKKKKVKNEIDTDPEMEVVASEALNLQQRIQRGRTMRRIKNKLRIGRERAEKRMASPEKLRIRARRAAIKILRKKVAGEKGIEYQTLSPSQKLTIDKKVELRKKAIERIAKKLIPKERQLERERKSKNLTASQNTKTEYMHFDNNAELYEVMDKLVTYEKIPAEIYNDYLEERVLEWGTDRMADTYKKDTPGQNRVKDSVLEKIKKKTKKKS